MLNTMVLGSNPIMNNKYSLLFHKSLFLTLNLYVSFWISRVFLILASTNSLFLLPAPNTPQHPPTPPNISQKIIYSLDLLHFNPMLDIMLFITRMVFSPTTSCGAGLAAFEASNNLQQWNIYIYIYILERPKKFVLDTYIWIWVYNVSDQNNMYSMFLLLTELRM